MPESTLANSRALPDSTSGGVTQKPHDLSWTNDVDLEEKVNKHGKREGTKSPTLSLLLLSYGAVGIVYGDIGTSPLYVYASIFPDGAPDDENILLGAFSMIFWTITVIVLIKYVLIMLRADDNGEGGIISLYSLIKRAAGVPTLTHLSIEDDDQRNSQRKSGKIARHIGTSLHNSRWQQITLLVIVLLGVNMIISDGILTPAISVISAVEGIQYNTHISRDAVIGITISILVVLFISQRFGTGKISFLFSPIILLWLLGNCAIGIYNLSTYPSVAKGLSPSYIYWYWSGRSTTAWRGLGSIFLSITGAEALYADLGHFNAKAIQLSFIGLVYPSLIFTYLGQTAYLIQNKADSPVAFWASIPHAVYIPMVIFATLAAIIASQALITGAFSITKHGMSLRCFPRFTIRHTSTHHEGQVYIPEINYSLMVGAIIIVVAFKDSLHIGNAYGLSIVIVMVVDTFLLALVMLLDWNWYPLIVGTFFLVYTFISVTYLSSLVEKVPHGAWFSLVVAGILSIISFVYWWGRAQKASFIRENIVPLEDLFESAASGKDGILLKKNAGTDTDTAAAVDTNSDNNKNTNATSPGLLPEENRLPEEDEIEERTTTTSAQSAITVQLFSKIKPLRFVGTKLPVARLPGLGIYYSETLNGVPPVLVRFLSLSPAIHEAVVFVTIRCVLLPQVPDEERLLVRKLNVEGFYHIVARYGYMEDINQGQDFVKLVVDELLAYLHQSSIEEARQQTSQQVLDLTDDEIGNVTGGSNSLTRAAVSTGRSGYGGGASRLFYGNDSLGRTSFNADDSTYTVNTQIARRMFSQIQAKLRGESGEIEGDEEKGMAGSTAGAVGGTTSQAVQPSRMAQLLKKSSSRLSSPRKTPQTHHTAGGSGGGRAPPLAAIQSLPRKLPGQTGPVDSSTYPWVAQPSVFNKSCSSRFTYEIKQSVSDQRDASTTLPLPRPPPRPPLHQFSNSGALRSQELEKDASRVRNMNIRSDSVDIFSMRDPALTVAGRNARLLSLRLLEEKAKVEEAAAAEALHASPDDKFAEERQLLLSSYANGVVYLVGRGEVRGKPGGKGFRAWLHRFILEGPYSFLVKNSRSASYEYQLPTDSLLEMKMRYEI